MGQALALESRPTIRGETPNISNENKSYFNRIKTIIRNNYINNKYNDQNLNNSLEIKSFTSNSKHPNDIQDISWLDYIENHIQETLNRHHYSWCGELLLFIQNQNFVTENKYDSYFFYNEYLITTIPQSLNSEQDIDNDENVIDVDKYETNTYMSNPIIMDELDVTANLGGSYLELNVDDLLPDDPTLLYQKKRKFVKKYIRIFKEHIFKNNEHPIMCIISGFNKIFCKYVNKNIKTFEDELKNGNITGEEYNEKLKNFEIEITSSLQDFMVHTHCTLKLFYSTVIDYAPLQQEKDDLINMLITLFFKTGSLYETIYNLYNLAFSQQIQDLQDKLIRLRNVKPKNLGVQVKFCLDDDTLELQQSILKEKREEKEKNNNSNNNNNNEDKKSEKIIEKQSSSGLDLIKEGDEEEKEEEDNIITNTTDNKFKNKIKSQEIDKKDDGDYLLENIHSEMFDDSKNENVPLYAGFAQIRNTINSFNNRKFLFPKLHNKLRDTIAIKDQYISEAKVIGKLPVPYLSAIKLLTTLKKYKSPFEKIVIIAAISDQIMECATSFWSEMDKYIKTGYLSIEADEIMTIFLFIMIKCQMPEIIIFSKMITNFTTPSTRAFSISYNFTLLEASLEYISTLKNLKELIKDDDNQLKDARQSLAGFTNQRLSSAYS